MRRERAQAYALGLFICALAVLGPAVVIVWLHQVWL